MTSREDPITRANGRSEDLHGITTWEPRSVFDRLLARYTWPAIRAGIVFVALVIFLLLVVLLGLQMLLAPGALLALVLFPLSVVPAVIIVGYVWYTDVSREPVMLLLATFVLGVVLSAFPFVTNTLTLLLIGPLFEIPWLGFPIEALYFYLVVAPVEEAVTLGAVFAYVYWKDDFDTVVDGAVYGAAAGLGFATIENFSYIVQVLAEAGGTAELLVGAGVITTLRGIVGPGHVIWTALAGYYLGLAKFNREYAVVLIAKGLLIVILLHGTYNTATSAIGRAGDALGLGGLTVVLLVGFIVSYHGIVLVYLLVRLSRYRRAYERAELAGKVPTVFEPAPTAPVRARPVDGQRPTHGDERSIAGAWTPREQPSGKQSNDEWIGTVGRRKVDEVASRDPPPNDNHANGQHPNGSQLDESRDGERSRRDEPPPEEGEEDSRSSDSTGERRVNSSTEEDTDRKPSGPSKSADSADE